MYSSKIIDEILRKNKFDLKTFRNAIKLSLSLIKEIEDIDLIFQKGLEREFSSKIAELCLPKPKNEKEKSKKLEINEKLPILLKIINDNKSIIGNEKELESQIVSFEILKPLFDELYLKFVTSVSNMEKVALLKSNPFITVTIKESYEEGKKFQIAAKVASSVETKWGSWIEKVLPMFNNKINIIGAGGYDYVLNNIAYDIKSGPNVMNKDQVEVAKIKRETIQNLSKEEGIENFVSVNNFKVAIAYGKSSMADKFMTDNADLIIFGADCWNELTGDDMNVLRLFLWQLKYQIIERKAHWNSQNINECISDFMQTFYDEEIDQKLEIVASMKEFKELKTFLE